MPLTLARPDTDRIAPDLANLVEETVEDAVAEAIRDRFERERRRRDREEPLARARRIVRESAAGSGAGIGDPAAFLYDDRGLPA